MSFLPDSHVVNGLEGTVPAFIQNRVVAEAPKYNFRPSFPAVEISDSLVAELASKHPAITDGDVVFFLHQ